MKKQVIVIHGGETFDSYKNYLTFLKGYKIDKKYVQRLSQKGWRNLLQEKLGKNYDVVLLRMPNSLNAKYSEWKIWFDKFIPHIKNNVTLIGYSLGGIFLAKYLSENKFPKKIMATHLVAAPFDDTNSEYSLGDFKLRKDLSTFAKQGGHIHLFFSEDDPITPFEDTMTKYKKALHHQSVIINTFMSEGHFDKPKFVNSIAFVIKNPK